MASQVERILILAKTYPSPSAQHVETSCVAGINEQGTMRRLYPVPFRLIEEGQKFKKWQWIDVRVEKANADHRTESHKLFVDTITCGDMIDTNKQWAERWKWIEKLPTFTSFDDLESARIEMGLTLALIKPKSMLKLEIIEARNSTWTDEEKEKLLRDEMQGQLFNDAEVKKITHTLRKVPYDFYYRYICDTPEGEKVFKHKIVDWEAGALFWRCQKNYGKNWEALFRERLEGELATKDLMFLMGNLHRFQDQWLIISLIYPPKRKQFEVMQGSLF
jgi:hypothetical protein